MLNKFKSLCKCLKRTRRARYLQVLFGGTTQMLNWGIKVLQTSALPLGYGAIFLKRPTFVKIGLSWSGIRDSDSRLSPWQGDTLPLS
jgi:hypothetical protein